MSNAEQIAIVLYSAIGLIALWATLCMWRDYAMANFRQKLFDVRAELFDYARSGAVRFDNRSYRRLRDIANSLIRFAHEISFVRLAGTIALEKVRPCFRTLPNLADEIRADTDLGQEAKEKLIGFHARLFKLVFLQIVCTSFAAVPFLALYLFYGIVRYGKRKPPVDATPASVLDDPRLNHHIRVMEQQAVETRKRELEDLVTA